MGRFKEAALADLAGSLGLCLFGVNQSKLLCITDERVPEFRVLRPRLALVDGLPARRSRCPRILAVKTTGATDQNLPSEIRDVGSKKGSGKKEEVGAVDNYSRIDLDLLPKSLKCTSRLLRFGAEIDSTAQ
jgi:hypothetical protein